MKVLVVSGFLGAGKTTFITRMIQKCQRKFVVLENEMGAVGVDGSFLSSSLGEEIDIWELTEGCLCCSMKTDFATSVLTIENVIQPDYLLIEPTGVGMLSKIMDNLKKIAYERIELLSPVTILDSLNYRHLARDFPEIFYDQLATAGTVVFSKTENLSVEEKNDLEHLVKTYAPLAEIVTQPYARQPANWWDGLWRKALDGTILKEDPHDNIHLDLAVTSLVQVQLSSLSEMVFFLEDVLRGRFGNIVRAKGTIKIENFMLRFDVAGGQYRLTGTEHENDVSQAVFIGKNLNVLSLCNTLKASVLSNAT